MRYSGYDSTDLEARRLAALGSERSLSSIRCNLVSELDRMEMFARHFNFSLKMRTQLEDLRHQLDVTERALEILRLSASLSQMKLQMALDNQRSIARPRINRSA